MKMNTMHSEKYPTRIVMHIDFDYFYAQCEEVRSQELKTKPVCVCVFSDRGGDSGAIATANYTARKYGVKSGIPIAFAPLSPPLSENTQTQTGFVFSSGDLTSSHCA